MKIIPDPVECTWERTLEKKKKKTCAGQKLTTASSNSGAYQFGRGVSLTNHQGRMPSGVETVKQMGHAEGCPGCASKCGIPGESSGLS